MIIDYYFSVLSDWAYFGGERLERIARRQNVAVNYMPTKLSEIYAGTGGILLQNRSKQRQDYRVIELRRWRDILGIPITIFPKYYPTADELASCLIIAAKNAHVDTGRLANSILRAIWVEDRNIANEETLRSIADGLGLDGRHLLEAAKKPETMEEFSLYTVEAQARGVFGSPFYFFQGDIFWGQDRLDLLEQSIVKYKESQHSKS